MGLIPRAAAGFLPLLPLLPKGLCSSEPLSGSGEWVRDWEAEERRDSWSDT